MSARQKMFLGCVAAIGGLSLAAASQAATVQLWGTGFETTNGVPGHASQVDSSVTAPHSGDFSGRMDDNTSHFWNGFNLPVGNLPVLGAGESFGSFTFSFWAKTIEGDTPGGSSRTYQIVLQPDAGDQIIQYGHTDTAAGTWYFDSVEMAGVINAAYEAGARSIPSMFVQGTSTGFASFDNFYMDDVSIDYTIVPEPASMSVVALGAMALLAKRRRSA